ncbi:apical endosomal glycoprotein [Hemicordylus capensis]|uniref:apical endosomal glycoprotein n=1 Tax=Hemicordylus capensis TaxID=884348 RepID=UPI002303B77E|nr:apical endosomal glycoprotein [Hemicordylus capensis]
MLLEKLPAAFVNSCRSPNVCNFVCDCWDCSDENQCGYEKGPPVLEARFTCNFEGSTCGWRDVSTTAYQWVPAQASIKTWGAEPPFDHTLGTDLGWYMTTTKQRGKPSATARLRSPLLREAAAACEIRAWYHLWGPGLSETQVPALTLEMSHGNNTVTLWRNPEGSVYPWRELIAFTGRIRGTFQLTFSLTQAFSETIHVALDDVQFRDCGLPRPWSCGQHEHPCQQGGCIAVDRLCDGTEDCGDGMDETHCDLFHICPFEDGWCGWAAEPQGLPWVRNSSRQLTPSHARPTRDHSTNTQEGHFIFVNNGPLDLRGGKARLVSSTLVVNSTGGPCYLILYIHLYGSNANSLNIYYRTEGNVTRLVRSRSGDLDDFWFREKADFSVAGKFQIIIEGVIGTGHKGNIALDDLILSPGCIKHADPFPVAPQPDPPVLCSPEHFACETSKECIGAELVCNFHTECDDGSDEWHCGATTFANSTGGWMDVSVGRVEWVVHREDTRLNAPAGFFGLQKAPGQMFSLARATTPVLGPSGLACDLEMDFTTGPQGLLGFAVADELLGTRWAMWYALGNGSTEWTRTRLPLGARKRPFQLELLALEDLTGTEEPFLAVRNISFVNCSPNASLMLPSGLSCNFEEDWCGWFMEQNYGFEWERSTSQGWAEDHTTGQGSFLSVNPVASRSQGLSARLASSPQEAAGNVSCLSFWYRMDGPQIGTLNLKVKCAGELEQVLWTRTGSQGAVWHRGVATITHQPGGNYQVRVVFEALRNGFLGAMALDDITVTPQVCPAQKHCSFETDGCGFSVERQDSWVRQDGLAGQGPPTDHTLGTPTGHYMVIGTSSKALPSGQKATLRSQAFLPLRHAHCVTFWYHLSSSDPGVLHAFVEEEGARREGLSISAMQGKGWHYGSFSVQVQQGWQVVFVAEGAGGGSSSYVALDDFSVTDGDCPKAGSCGFESGPCGWSKPQGDWNSWDWKEGATPSQSTSPKEDRTLGTKAGHYAYVDIALLGMGRNPARLASEPLPATSSSCLLFHYHMDFLGQSSQAELRLILSSELGERVVWSAVGDQGRAWRNQTLAVTSPAEFQIVLEASSGAWPNSETIAVDDISYAADCNSSTGGGQEGGGDSGSHSSQRSDAGLVAGLVCSILLAIIGAFAGVYCLKKRRGVRGGALEDSTTSTQGFDNIAFRDDRVIIPPMPLHEDIE